MMTDKEARKWLGRARGLEKEIKQNMERRDREYTRLVSITQKLTGDIISETKDPHKYDILVELNDTITQRCEELRHVQAEVMGKINQIPDRRYREVLSLYYLDSMSIESAAKAMHYSFQHVKRLRVQAIEEIRKIL